MRGLNERIGCLRHWPGPEQVLRNALPFLSTEQELYLRTKVDISRESLEGHHMDPGYLWAERTGEGATHLTPGPPAGGLDA